MMKNAFLVLFLLCSVWAADYRLLSPERVTIPTTGNISLVGTWYGVEQPNPPAVILVHMLGRNRGDWNALARYIQKEGIAVLSFDLRGHGESTAQGTITWKIFNQADFRKNLDDLDRAYAFIVSRGADSQRVGLIGMDLGANCVLTYASMNKKIASLILIAPGKSRKGIPGLDQVDRYGARPLYVLYTTAQQNQVQDWRASLKGLLKVDVYEAGLHPTVLFRNQQALAKNIVQWLQQTLQQNK